MLMTLLDFLLLETTSAQTTAALNVCEGTRFKALTYRSMTLQCSALHYCRRGAGLLTSSRGPGSP